MALVYRRAGTDPLEVIGEVLEPLGDNSFFQTPRYADLLQQVGEEGPLIYADGRTFATDADGVPRTEWVKRIQMPTMVRTECV